MLDFPLSARSLPETPDGYVYVLCWIRNGAESAFYVGQTKRLARRMNDYRVAQFAACTDFRVGEAVRYLRDGKKCRIVVRYKVSTEMRKEEYGLIRELHLSGVRLMNDFSSYDYRMANETEERVAVQKFCDVIISKSESWKVGEIGNHPSEPRKVEGLAAKGRSVVEETIHIKQKIFNVVSKCISGREFSCKDLRDLIDRDYPGTNHGSIQPSDYVYKDATGHDPSNDGNRDDYVTYPRFLEKVEKNRYRFGGWDGVAKDAIDAPVSRSATTP